MTGDVIARAIRDPWVVVAAAFMLGLLVPAVVLAVANTKRWHTGRHVRRGVSDPIDCDHCRRERDAYQDSLRRPLTDDSSND